MDYTQDLIFETHDPDLAMYPMVTVGPRGGLTCNSDMMVRYLKDSLVVYEANYFYKFDGCVYKPISEEGVKNILHLALDRYMDSQNLGHIVLRWADLRDIINKLKAVSTLDNIPDIHLEAYLDQDADSDIFDDVKDIRDVSHLIPFRNGLYHVKTGQLLPFTPGLFITH